MLLLILRNYKIIQITCTAYYSDRFLKSTPSGKIYKTLKNSQFISRDATKFLAFPILPLRSHSLSHSQASPFPFPSHPQIPSSSPPSPESSSLALRHLRRSRRLSLVFLAGSPSRWHFYSLAPGSEAAGGAAVGTGLYGGEE